MRLAIGLQSLSAVNDAVMASPAMLSLLVREAALVPYGASKPALGKRACHSNFVGGAGTLTRLI